MKPLALLVTKQRCFTRSILFATCRHNTLHSTGCCSAGPSGGGACKESPPGLLRGPTWGAPWLRGQSSCQLQHRCSATCQPSRHFSLTVGTAARRGPEKLATWGTGEGIPKPKCTVCCGRSAGWKASSCPVTLLGLTLRGTGTLHGKPCWQVPCARASPATRRGEPQA